MKLVVLAIALSACAPSVDGPTAQLRARDREDALALQAQLAALPQVLSATVTLHRAAADPLSTDPPTPATAAIVIVTEGPADRAHMLATAQTLIHATTPEIAAPTIVVEAGAPRPELASVGPFTVAASSRGALRATLALALIAIAALALAVAYYRRTAAPART